MVSRRHKYSYTTQKEKRKKAFSVVKVAFLVFILYYVVSSFLLGNIAVKNSSMRPGIEPGDRILITPLIYGPPLPLFGARLPGFSKPKRGDIVLLRPPYLSESTGFPLLLDAVVRFVTLQNVSILNGGRDQWEKSELLKRVVALPGDSVYVKDFVVYVKPKGSAHYLTEYEVGNRVYDLKRDDLPDNWDPSFPFSGSFDPIELGEGRYFVIGDNRIASSDSRYWGTIGERDILAEAILRYWPLRRFGAL
jgi:signal peptidase I